MEVVFHPGKGKDRYYLIDGEREIDGVPIVSVTTILKEIGDKFGQAAWWGMTQGVAGYWELQHLPEFNALEVTEPAEVIPLLTKHKLTVNHVRDKAGERGTSVHDAAETWATTGELPHPPSHQPHEQGYVKALHAFITDSGVTPLAAEVLVGSRKHAYAGTFDLLASGGVKTWDDRTLSGVGIFDYKTKTKVPKGKKREAYEQHHLQLQAYSDAHVEMGSLREDFQAVVNLYPDGSYAVIEGRATSEQWSGCLKAYRSLSGLRESLRAA